MPYHLLSLLSVLIFTCVHLWAEKSQKLAVLTHGKFFSFGGGVSIAYVFVDILPKLCKNEILVKKSGAFPFIEQHVFVMGLAGFLLFFSVARSHSMMGRRGNFWLSLACYAFFNFLVGYAVVDKDNPEVRPLALFTFAMALHYFTNDYTLSKIHGKEYEKFGRWILIGALFLGWLSGFLITLSEVAVALLSAFIGGGVIMNVTQYELPEENPKSLAAFLFGAGIYALVLITFAQANKSI